MRTVAQLRDLGEAMVMLSLTGAPSTACDFVRTCLLWSFPRGHGICLVGGKAGRPGEALIR
jgi:hypothetical protein